METLLIPLVIILAPFFKLLLVLSYLNGKSTSWFLKISVGLVFIAIGIITTFWAMTMASHALSEKGVRCMTGLAVFILLGLLVNIVGIPSLLIFYKVGTKNISG